MFEFHNKKKETQQQNPRNKPSDHILFTYKFYTHEGRGYIRALKEKKF